MPKPNPQTTEPKLEDIEKMRAVLKACRENPSLPSRVQNPVTGEIIDILDGETDKLLDELEFFIRRKGHA